MKNPDKHIPNWRIIGINDLRYWNVPEKYKAHIVAILSVYMYDAASATYCCEITPSHDLGWLRFEVICTDATSDELREEIWEWATSEHGEDTYMHVSDVLAHPSQPYFETEEKASEAFAKDPDDLSEDAVREYWQGNHPCLTYK